MSAPQPAVLPAPQAEPAKAKKVRSSGSGLSDLLQSKKRHYFIISSSGRPIYTRHGETHEAATVAATIFGLASMAQDSLGTRC